MPGGGERFGAWYDEKAAARAVAFFPRYLRHVEGEWAGQRFELTDWQRDRFILPTFGWKRADGSRLVRTVYGEIPRKNGKTSLGAGLACLLLVGDGERGGQGYAMAVDKDQAGLLFGKAGQMVNASPELSEVVEVYKTSVFCPGLAASFKPLSRTVANKHGFSPSFALGDELHEWPDGEVAEVVHKGMAARRQPLEVYITTAGLKGRGYGWEMHDYAARVLSGEIEDPSFLPVIYAADEDDDWTDPATWAKANPNLGSSVKLAFLEAECEKARRSPRLENDFRRFHLNQWTEQVTRWLPMAAWKACTANPADPNLWQRFEERLRGKSCFGGIDLGATRDVSALVWVFPVQEGVERVTVVCRFWVPKATMADRVERFRVPYDEWARRGALTETPGNVTDYGEIRRRVLEDAERFQVQGLALDRWNGVQLGTELLEDGAPVEFFGQGYNSMAGPSRELERLVISGELEHGSHPVLTWMAGNASVKEDPAGNIKPDKASSTEKIDGIVAAIEALGLLGKNEAEGPSVYEDRGVLVF